MDLSQENSIIDKLDEFSPNIIINCGAYTAVDKAESDVEMANKINHLAVKTIGDWAKKNSAKVIHISTDYVFDGKSEKPLQENEKTNPINVYGKTKLDGEKALIDSESEYIIIRTAWVYSTYGANFVKTMIRLMSEKEEISVINDQIGSPTYARDLAVAIINIIESDVFEKGIYHYSNNGKISWYDFAVKIKELSKLNCKINPIPTKEYPTPAKRPNFSLLDKSKIVNTFGVNVPNWDDSLKEMINKLNN